MVARFSAAEDVPDMNGAGAFYIVDLFKSTADSLNQRGRGHFRLVGGSSLGRGRGGCHVFGAV